ncbi:MAG: DEAD/DEAH box helicase family protein [Coriobacteriia bacterium]|nr:DEAD/DEAH box helicase family protein [Coriobacteriia bacterium]
MALITAKVPKCLSKRLAIGGNLITQLLARDQECDLVQDALGNAAVRLESGEVVRLSSRKPALAPGERAIVISRELLDGLTAPSDLRTGRWVGDLSPSAPAEVRASLKDAFSFQPADEAAGRPGLRSPQLGAVHSVVGYWTTRNPEPATVVMPTGTGKTETMLALFAAQQLERVLLVVPSDALRTQVAGKFLSFGVLQTLGVVSPQSLRPVVGEIRHGIKSNDHAAQIAAACNVIVATPQALMHSEPSALRTLLDSCTHMFVDEAHHLAATTWRQLRDDFAKKPVVQFTATPFREDGKHIGGRMIYAFPLREAQRQGYFSTINYMSVLDLGSPDLAIAEAAVRRLRDDLHDGLDHLLMARVSRIGRATEVLAHYAAIAADYQPLILHSTLPAKERQAALDAIRTRQSRIVICVNMLGEGFDLPALKIAAIHDAHKSLGVTLQFVGRFARTGDATLGEATVVVGRPDRDFDPQLRSLYAEDADWNRIIRDLSATAVGEQQEESEFEAAFGSLPEEVAMRSLLPKMSTVAYRTNVKDWDIGAVSELFPPDALLTLPIAVNERDKVAWFVSETHKPVVWGDVKTVEEIEHHLYVLYWDQAKRLLYVNSSNTASHHEELAQVVCGKSAQRITGENVYRVMADLKRLVPTNVGLLDVRNRSRRFSMHVGADVTEGFPIAEAQTKTKTNIFAYGYENGAKVSIGASLKGRVWSHMVANSIKQWTDWCDHVGAKLADEGISVDEVMLNFIRPQAIEVRPALIPLGIDWPWTVYANQSEDTRLEFNGSSVPLVDVDFKILTFQDSGPIGFSVATEDWSLEYELTLGDGRMRFSPKADDASVVTARNAALGFADFLNRNGSYVYFEKDALAIPGAMLLRPDRSVPPFDPQRLEVLDWAGVQLNIESQGSLRRADSVQHRVIAHVSSIADWDIVMDDDGSGEVADVVALRVDGDTLRVFLVHCKYVAGGRPRAQVADLYEVCGQAQKSVIWRRNGFSTLIENLIRRERGRVRRGADGFVVGTAEKLYELHDMCRMLKPILTIAVAQPGVAKAQVSQAQLELLATTELYLSEAATADFEVYCSE